ncbi:N-acetylglucosamine-6-phosphate deacetylase [Pedobacter sp. MC2016-24]|uniref:N-acetylglucosamine-6-phosphate deacetylase n=1 Tax=Pedobacter sp. MC2016-24 TaxID=2780090 RepID=UPI001881C889|nr:N-acetylglucosamine-6-phosphate deacetylase [Pedobacter sp. MC2016-24]MBE9598766.1 N-acetylglucosamine-6-phosphate deacetylase [Pedobacter sp. MC2016-24]
MSVTIQNARFYTEEDTLAQRHDLHIEAGRISALSVTEIQDNAHHLVVPGFVDLQIYGGGGRLFSAEPSVETLRMMEDDLLSKGTTGFLACMATNTPEVFNSCIEAAKAHRGEARNFLGLHLEGPFLNAKRRGAHVEAYIRKATLDEIKALLDFGDGVIKMMTIAPELQDDVVIEYLLDHGVLLSLGHSDATFEQATAAYNKGIATTTHLFNAMTPIHHREPGIPTAVFNHDEAKASIIADGQHVDFEVVKFSQKILKERLFLITDAVAACDHGPYQHMQMGDKFVVPDVSNAGGAVTLSGSSLTMLQAVKNCVAHCGISLSDALKMAALYPAKLIGLSDQIGKVALGYTADLLVLDNELNLKEVWLKGQKV